MVPPAPLPPRPPAQLTFHLIPHTHWDREWYLTKSAFQARLVPVLDAIIAELTAHPGARFLLDGQTVLLEDYLAIKPAREAELAALVRGGRLEIGPWYILSDLLVPSGASLRRNLEEGIRDAARFGAPLPVLYSPDAFGHPAELPDLAAEFGLRWAVVRRGIGRPAGKDTDLYRWESSRGNGLLVYHLPAGGYDTAMALAQPGADLPTLWRALRQELVARAGSREIAVFLGADHHAMALGTVALCERLQALEPEHTVRLSGLGEFFAALERTEPEPPVLRGELRRGEGHTWVLQGVHATRARIKRHHTNAELVLARIAEPLAALARRRGADQSDILRAAWRTLLQCQFHDTLAGTTSDAVQREQAVRLEAVETLAREVSTRCLAALVGHDPDGARLHPERVTPTLVLWNPATHSRGGIATAELTFFRRDVLVGSPTGRQPRAARARVPRFVLETPEGELLPVQVLASRRGQERLDAARHYPDQDEVERIWVAFQAPKLPALAVRTLCPRSHPARPPAAGLRAEPASLGNRYVTLGISPVGAIDLTDARTGERYRSLGRLEDEPDRGDLYTFSRGRGAPVLGGAPGTQRLLARGPLLAALETRWTLRSAGRGTLGVRLVVVLHADSPLALLRFELAHAASGHRLRARFPVGVGGAVVAGAPLGSLRRPPAEPAPQQAGERESPTAPAQRYVAAAAGARGLAVIAPGSFEYEWTPTGDLLVTLLRAVGELSRSDLPERPGHAAWPLATPEAEEPGTHRIEWALAPVREADAAPARLERLWEAAFLPLQACFLRDFCAG